jgi:hypothetical protein
LFTTQPHDVVTAGTISFIEGGPLVGPDSGTSPHPIKSVSWPGPISNFDDLAFGFA